MGRPPGLGDEHLSFWVSCRALVAIILRLPQVLDLKSSFSHGCQCQDYWPVGTVGPSRRRQPLQRPAMSEWSQAFGYDICICLVSYCCDCVFIAARFCCESVCSRPMKRSAALVLARKRSWRLTSTPTGPNAKSALLILRADLNCECT